MSKISTERTQRALLELVSQPGNDICADCKSRNPRWASYNLGIFICMNCASIHRKLGSHITKVKSLTMDTWTKDQVDHMKRNGNAKSNLYYNPNEAKNPPPANMIESERDSELEKYIRAKYEGKRFVDKSAFVAAQLGPSRSAASLATERQPRPQSTPLSEPFRNERPPPPQLSVPSDSSSVSRPLRSVSQPLQQFAPTPSTARASMRPPQHSNTLPVTAPSSQPSNPLWADLVSLQNPSMQATLPLQYQPSQAPVMHAGTQDFGQIGGQTFSNAYTLPSAAPNPFLQMQQQSQVQYLIPSQPFASTATPLPTHLNQQLNQPQVASFGQQYFAQPSMQAPSPQPFAQPAPVPQNGFLTPSPHPQTPFGADMTRSSPSPFMQPNHPSSPFSQPFQAQPQYIATAPTPFGVQAAFQPPSQMTAQQPQQDQFTSWLSKGPGSGFGQR